MPLRENRARRCYIPAGPASSEIAYRFGLYALAQHEPGLRLTSIFERHKT
jgi:hypothetical protein